MNKKISTKAHGVMDYTLGTALLLAPYIFNFAKAKRGAKLAPSIAGLGMILTELMTRDELGAVKKLPMKTHLKMDYVAGTLLALSPLFFKSTKGEKKSWLPHVAAGAGIILESLFTKTKPKRIFRAA